MEEWEALVDEGVDLDGGRQVFGVLSRGGQTGLKMVFVGTEKGLMVMKHMS